MTDAPKLDRDRLERWLERLRGRDPELYEALMRKRARAEGGSEFVSESTVALEAAVSEESAISLETIVREGRPALMVRNGRITRENSFIDEASEVIVARLEAARAGIESMIPLVGRVDVANHPTGLDFLGTAWLVADDVVVTNRHVAELLARRDIDAYRFVAGRFGDPVEASLGYGHEIGGDAGPAARILEVLFIEPTASGPDIAFLRVDRRPDGATPKYIEIAASDPSPGQDVVTVGYPARAPSNVIPDQERMERLYGRLFDIKRAAPGQIDDPSRGWSTHDCTTLGGNSGSAVLDMASGRACALHFAGLYLVENYAVPASTLRSYLGRRPWPYRIETPGPVRPGPPALAPQAQGPATVTIPLTLTISLGQPVAVAAAGPAAGDPRQAARELAQSVRGGGVLAVRSGLVVEGDALREEPCLVIAASPERLSEVRSRVPAVFAGLPVQVRPASIDDQLGLGEAIAEAPRSIAYDDEARSGPDFKLDWVREPMKLRCHVGPDRSFEELSGFLHGTESELVSAMYQFHADHVRAAVDNELRKPGVNMRLVADGKTRDSDHSGGAGRFDRSEQFKAWADTGRFENVYVPQGNGGLVDIAYHIKVTVKDRGKVWLSSGNWTRNSQPLIAPAHRLDPGAVTRSGNREWHVIAESPTLATRFRSHILQDLARSRALGGQPEALHTTLYVDVPEIFFEAIFLEAAADRVFEPENIEGDLRVMPLLTPDHEGGIYCDAVMELIASARSQLLFQNQYIRVSENSAGRFGALVDALARASQRLPDCRIILRSGGAEFWDDVAELSRRGIDITARVRRLADTHTKGIVVDGRQVLVGSHNWSQSGVTLNRDASLVIDDPRAASYFAAVFEADWKRSTLITEPRPVATGDAPRIATGDSPPPGFRRVPLSELIEG
jgi:hypothetical protein